MMSSDSLLLSFIGAGLVFVLCFAVYLGSQIQRKTRRHGLSAYLSIPKRFPGLPVSDTTEGQLFKIVVLDDCCPDCGQFGFLAGPSGGISQNIFCANVECRSGFNVTPLTPTQGFAERIGRGDRSLYPSAEKGQ